LLSNDIFRGVKRDATDETVSLLARGLVPIVALVAVWFTLGGGTTIVALLLMGYNFVTQMFPAVVASLFPTNRVTKYGAFCGILAGVIAVLAISLTHTGIREILPFLPTELQDINVGFAALILNIVVTFVVSALTRQAREAARHA
jgi:SSS family solute:Na+ symporter